MKPEAIFEIAKICCADPEQLREDINKYGIKNFFVRIDFLDYPDEAKKKLKNIQRLLIQANSEEV